MSWFCTCTQKCLLGRRRSKAQVFREPDTPELWMYRKLVSSLRRRTEKVRFRISPDDASARPLWPSWGRLDFSVVWLTPQNVHVYLASLVTPAEAGFTGQEKDDKRSAEAGSTFWEIKPNSNSCVMARGTCLGTGWSLQAPLGGAVGYENWKRVEHFFLDVWAFLLKVLQGTLWKCSEFN